MSDGMETKLKANGDDKSIPCHGNRVPVGVTSQAIYHIDFVR
jgi:hypothetical protein